MRGPARGRAQDEVGRKTLLATGNAHAARPRQAARGQIAVAVAHTRLVPARLGVAEQKQLEHLDAALPEWAKGAPARARAPINTRLP